MSGNKKLRHFLALSEDQSEMQVQPQPQRQQQQQYNRQFYTISFQIWTEPC